MPWLDKTCAVDRQEEWWNDPDLRSSPCDSNDRRPEARSGTLLEYFAAGAATMAVLPMNQTVPVLYPAAGGALDEGGGAIVRRHQEERG